jgi:hypothetical protein
MNQKITPSYFYYLVPATVAARQFIMPVCESLAHLGFGTPVVGYDPAQKVGSVRNHLRIIQIDSHNWYSWLDDTMRLSFDVHLDGEDDSCLCGFRRAADGTWYAVAPSRPDKARIAVGHTRNITLHTILETAVQLFEAQLAEWTPRGRDMRPALVAAYRKQLGLPPVSST